MGLDQYAGVMQEKKSEYFKNEDGSYDTWQSAGPFEWRKHARLQEFMNTLYMEKNNTEHKWENREQEGKVYSYPISWNQIELVEDDINKLEEAINNGYSRYFCDGGFFWGHEFQEESAKEYKTQDEEFVKFAKIELGKGNKIYYECSW